MPIESFINPLEDSELRFMMHVIWHDIRNSWQYIKSMNRLHRLDPKKYNAGRVGVHLDHVDIMSQAFEFMSSQEIQLKTLSRETLENIMRQVADGLDKGEAEITTKVEKENFLSEGSLIYAFFNHAARNSIDAIEKRRGTITLTISEYEGDIPFIVYAPSYGKAPGFSVPASGPFIKFGCKDTGTGFEGKEKDAIMPGYSTKGAGRGHGWDLGIAISKILMAPVAIQSPCTLEGGSDVALYQPRDLANLYRKFEAALK